jgi:hypothetical protein
MITYPALRRRSARPGRGWKFFRIEMTAERDGIEIHILGYLIDGTHKAFLAMLRKMQEVRVRAHPRDVPQA